MDLEKDKKIVLIKKILWEIKKVAIRKNVLKLIDSFILKKEK